MNVSDRRKFLLAGSAVAASLTASMPVHASPIAELAVVASQSVAGSINSTTAKVVEPVLQIGYLEIVTPDVEAICGLYSELHGVKFGEADQALGNARTAKLKSGGLLGVRAPMHAGERPVVRPYLLVDDIESAVAAASKKGAEVIVPPMKLGGHGTCAILVQGEIELGLWQGA